MHGATEQIKLMDRHSYEPLPTVLRKALQGPAAQYDEALFKNVSKLFRPTTTPTGLNQSNAHVQRLLSAVLANTTRKDPITFRVETSHYRALHSPSATTSSTNAMEVV